MLVESIKKLSKYKYLIHMDSGDVLPMSGKDILLYQLREGMEVSGEQWQEVLAGVRRDCLRKCGTLLSSRDYSVARLREKLIENRFPESIAAQAIEELKEAGYMDDRRIAANYVRIHTKDRSRRRILMDLARLGISSGTAQEALDAEYTADRVRPVGQDKVGQDKVGQDKVGQDKVGQDKVGRDKSYAASDSDADPEIEQIRALMQKRHFDPDGADRTAREKFMAYLYRRGYNTDSIRAAMRSAR